MGLNYNSTIVPDGLVMYFDPANSRSSVGSGNTIYDLSGNSNTCTFSATPTYDVASKGNIRLAGYGTIPHSSTLWGSNQFTLSVWAKRTSGTSGIMISKDTNYIDHQYNGKTLASFYATAAYSPRQYLVSGISTSINNEWRHYASTYDGTTGSLYENGVLIGTINMSVEILKSSDPFNIGRWNGGGYDFSGHLGTIMTYNRALSAQEIKQNYDATKGRYITLENIVTNGLILNIDPANSSSYSGVGNTIYDLSGFGNTGTLTNGPTFSGLNGGSITFDGSSNYIDLTPTGTGISLTSSSDYNISGWIYVEATQPKTNPSIVEKYNGIGGYPIAIRWSSNTLYTIVYDGTNGVATGASITPNTWTYFSANNILSQKKLEMYMNSSLIGSTTYSTLNNITTTASIKIGYRGFDANTYFAGKLAKLQIYNRALSATEVMQNYNATKGRFGL